MPLDMQNPVIMSDDELTQKFLGGLQVVEIDYRRLAEMLAFAGVVLERYRGAGGNEEGRILFLKSNLKGLVQACYTAGFQDGFFAVQNGFVFYDAQNIPGFLFPRRAPEDK